MILVDKLHKYFEKEFNLSELDSIKLKYSLEIIFNDLSKFCILLALFLILGTTTDFMYSSLVLLMIRPFTGGLHFETYSGCLIFSGFFFYVSIFLKNHITLNSVIIIIFFILSLLIITLFAPIAHESRPSYSLKKRRQFKLISIIFVSIHFCLYFFTNKNPYFINSICVLTLQSMQILIAKGVQLYEKGKSYI